MWRRTEAKRKYGTVILAALLSAAAAAAPQAADGEKAQICREDEYVLEMIGKTQSNVYDHDGNLVGRIPYSSMEYGFMCVPKSCLLSMYGDGIDRIISLETMDTILECPSDCWFMRGEGYFEVVDPQTGNMSLYDCLGNLVDQVSYDPSAPDEKTYPHTDFVALDSGILYGGILGESGEFRFYSYDRKEADTVRQPQLLNLLKDREIRLQSFGDYLYVYDYSSDLGSLYDLEGKEVLTDVERLLTERRAGSSYDVYETPRDKYLSRKSGYAHEIYDRELHCLGTVTGTEAPYENCGDFVPGLAYEELGGRVCEGWMENPAEGYLPYAKEENRFYVYSERTKELKVYDVPQEERLFAMNEYYYLTSRESGYDSEGARGEEISVYRSDGSLFSVSREYSGRPHLGTDCILLARYGYDDEERQFTIFDAEGDILYSQKTGWVQTWKNGCWLVTRGIYSGLTDREGNWIIRASREKE